MLGLRAKLNGFVNFKPSRPEGTYPRQECCMFCIHHKQEKRISDKANYYRISTCTLLGQATGLSGICDKFRP